MILGRRRKADKAEKERKEAQPAASPEPQAEQEVGEQLLDTLAALLRTWGEFPIEFESMDQATVREHFEAWARHALVAAPQPGSEEESPATAAARRDWPGLQRFVRDHRKSEYDHVQRSLTDLREVIGAFAQTLGRAIQEDRKTDGRMNGQLGKLRSAVDSSDTEALKREALRSITLIESMIEVRSTRQRTQVQQLAGRLDELNLELVDVREKLAKDPLTGIHNRAAFDGHMERLVDVQTVMGTSATLIMIDVDHFKWVNDRYGHPMGDTVLKEVAELLQQTFRRKGDFVARFGGDEFVAIVQGAGIDGVTTVCEKLLFSIRDMTVASEGEPIRVSVSIGAADFAVGDEMTSWLERADRALYVAKEQGRDRFALLDSDGNQVSKSA